MSALAHYFEEEGLATTLIALVREHAERIRPPRALAVPFELGRPLGVPDDSAFQKRVLRAALELLEAPAGPLLTDYPETAPPVEELTGWACPVSFPAPEPADDGSLRAALAREFQALLPWHDLSVERRGRSTVGASGLVAEALGPFLVAFLEGEDAPAAPPDVAPAQALKLASEDLKAFYFEAATAQPGRSGIREVEDWFWGETSAGELMLALKQACLQSDDAEVRWVGKHVMVPRSQLHREGEPV